MNAAALDLTPHAVTPVFPRVRPGGELPGLHGLRGVACLLVFAYHLAWAAGDPPLTLGGISFLPLLKHCDLGVAIFFILSGQLLSQPFWRAILNGEPWPSFPRYLWRRACRIVPAYYACLAAIYLLRDGTYTLFGFVDFALHAAFLHTFSDESYLSINGVPWSVGIEFQFYLLLPFIMAAVAWTWRRAGGGVTAVALVAATWAIDFAATHTLLALAPHSPARFLIPEGSVVHGTVFAFLKLFVFGILAGYVTLVWRRRLAWNPAGSKTAAHAATAVCALALAGTAALLWLSGEGWWRQIRALGWPANAALLALLAVSIPCSPFFGRLFSARLLVFAGEISYGIYLWHLLVQRAVFGGTLAGRLHGAPLFFTGGALALAVTVLLAWLSFRFLERPAMLAAFPLRHTNARR